MTGRQLRLASSRGSRGFALIIVLWVFALISLIVVHLTATARTELRIAGNLAAKATAQAAADGAIYQAIFNLVDPQPEERWPLDGNTHAVQVGDSQVALRVSDEAARVNPNLASPALLEAVLAAVAGNREQAAELASATAEWVGARKGPRPLSGIDADYRAAGLDYGPPGEPLQSIDELGRVRGMTPELLAALRPHLTLFGPAVPDPDGDDPVVAAAVAEIGRSGPSLPSPSLTPANPTNVLTARITATATGPGGAVANRTAIAKIGSGVPRGYAVLTWESGPE